MKKIWIKELKLTLKLAGPMIVGQLGQSLFGITDSLMVGRLGTVPLAASAFVNGIVSIALVFLLGVGSAVAVLTAQSYGAKREKDCGEYLYQGLLVMSAVALFVVGGLYGLRFFLSVFRQPPEVLAASYGYYDFMAASLIPMILFGVHRQFIEGLEKPGMSVSAMAVGLLVNVFFNWVFIYGNLGAPALGLTGAGLATFLARFSMFLFIALYVFRSRYFLRFREPFHLNYKSSYARRLLRIGIPGGMQYLFEVGAFVGASILMGWFGAAPLAAHQVALSMATVSFMVALGISFSVNVRVSYAAGERNFERARYIGMGAIVFVALMMSVFGLIFVLARHRLPAFYTTDLEVIQIAAGFLLVTAFFQVFDGAQAIGVGALRGLSDAKGATWITLAAYWGVGAPLCYLLGFTFGLGPMGVWYGLAVSLLVSSVLLALRFHHHAVRLHLKTMI